MTRIDFYVLDDTGLDAQQRLTCKVTEKAFKQGHQVYINTESTAQLQQLDDLMWTFRDGSFLPHERYTPEAAGEAVLLGCDTEPEGPDDVLVNLASEVPLFFSRFKRVVELVGGDEPRRAAARERFRFYKDRGYTLNTHRL